MNKDLDDFTLGMILGVSQAIAELLKESLSHATDEFLRSEIQGVIDRVEKFQSSINPRVAPKGEVV